MKKKTPLIRHKKKKLPLFRLAIFGKYPYLLHIILISLICVIIITACIFSPIFHISSNSLYIFRSDTLIDINRAYETLDYTRGKHIAFIDTRKIEERIKRSQPWIKKVYVRRSLLNKLYVSLQSQKVLFQSESFLFLENGSMLTKDNKKYIGTPLLKIHDSQQNITNTPLRQLDPKYLSRILLLQKELENNIPGFEYDIPLYYLREQELLLRHPRNTILIFDLDGDIHKQIERLSVFHTEQTNIHETSFIYIDLRVGRKIYVCPLKNEYRCRSNLERYYNFRTFEFLESL